MIHYRRVAFQYDPFPLGVITDPFDEADYRELTRTYPPLEAFVHHASLGHRYSLSTRHNRQAFRAHISQQPAWRELARWVSSQAFLTSTLDMLRAHAIDLGLTTQQSVVSRAAHVLRALSTGGLARGGHARTEMIFAMLPPDGGSLFPHTDEPSKLVNLATTMATAGEWDSAVGGGTDVNRPKNVRHLFNRTNRRLEFEDVDVVNTVPYRPNQMLVVVRSDISWHSIPPMRGTAAHPMRKTVNINIVSSL